jgi:hypothetical protein
MILAVGYRVRGKRGKQFRQWATRHLSEYLCEVQSVEELMGVEGQIRQLYYNAFDLIINDF